MVLGFNHNVMYKGEIFHVQTEDSGLDNPHIITLLFKGGSILASKKTSYADILKMERLEAVVEALMKEQHKEMMRRLTSGEFDESAPTAPTVSCIGGGEPDVPISTRHSSPPEPVPYRALEPPPSLAEAPMPSPASHLHGISTSNTSLDDAIQVFFSSHEN